MQISDEEEDIKEIYFIKNNNKITNSDSISALSENASTYLGVKTIPEGTIPDNNKSVKKKKSKKANKNKKTHNKENKRNIDSFSSNSSSSSSQNFSSSSSSPSNSSSIDFENLKDKKKNKNSKKKKKTKENEKNTKTKKKQKNRTIKEINEKNGEINKNSEKNEENEKKIGKKKAIKKDEIETFFEWDEGGNEVYLTGSFCDWKEFFLMTKNKDGKFTISLPLPRGFHQYKFKIDENWTYSKKQPKFEDNGNVNNFIDTTDFNNLNEEKKRRRLYKRRNN
jgi:5'-AMP-activated protein kinase regulatory beta subunit